MVLMLDHLSQSLRSGRLRVCAALMVLATIAAAVAQPDVAGRGTTASSTAVQPALSSAQIVEEMLRHNKARADGLKHYKSTRQYSVSYKGFAKVEARMVVEAEYDAVSGKSFRIVSQSGSNVLVEKVLKRLLTSEKDAAQDKSSTALTPANYKFRLTGTEDVAGRPSYVFEVEPKTASKYLYRGKIWIDAADFALARIEASPAKNPSFWISSTRIHHQYARTEGFWLPSENRSETRVRVGGTAVLTIDYGTYKIVPDSTVAAGKLF